ncbi:MAG: HRDC domain-containing protein [Nanoarchaeota archaeon]|nr:HRDC domain-containing protein [Nanoarchaeota archaeon]MBU1643973.1 HRDC domain-containing protein [Nanoarchaeota archaeon]MBU1977139.1 HRDC domain-containing protein [Nanoarchaeota archaeon]
MVNFIYIDTREELEKEAEKWTKADCLAIDLECENNLHHYGSYVSLIQISDGKNNWVVDVYKLKEIKPLIVVLENKNIQKIFHDVSFDFRILYNEFKCSPKNIFDTQVAALLLGKENIGLGYLLEEYFNIKKESRFQMADWTKRPLTSEMLSYAVKDVLYLIKLRDLLKAALKKKERLSWAEEEFEEIEKTVFTYKEQDYMGVRGVKELSPEQLSIFKQLFQLRKNLAEMVDKPVYFVISNKRLKELAISPSLDWTKVKGVHPIVRQNSVLLKKAVSEGREAPIKLEKNERKFHSAQQKQFFERLYELQKRIADKLEIKGHLVINKEQMGKIVHDNNLGGLREWQKVLLQKEGLKL